MLSQHGHTEAGGHRKKFGDFFFPQHSRHIIIPYGHPELNFSETPAAILDPSRSRPVLATVNFGSQPNSGSTRSLVLQGLQELKAQGMKVTWRHLTKIDRKPDKMRDILMELYNSTFCPCPRGNSDDTRRTFSALLAGCIPIIFSDWLMMPFESFISWDSIAYFVPEEEAKDFISSLSRIPESEIALKRSNINCIRQHFVYHRNGTKPGDAVDTIVAALSSRGSIARDFQRWFTQTAQRRTGERSPGGC